MDPDVLKQTAAVLMEAVETLGDRPFARAVLHDGAGKPCAVIIVASDPDVASRLAAMLPGLERRLGVEIDDERPSGTG